MYFQITLKFSNQHQFIINIFPLISSVASTHLWAVFKGWEYQRSWFHSCSHKCNHIQDMDISRLLWCAWVSNSQWTIQNGFSCLLLQLQHCCTLVIRPRKHFKSIMQIHPFPFLLSLSFSLFLCLSLSFKAFKTFQFHITQRKHVKNRNIVTHHKTCMMYYATLVSFLGSMQTSSKI